MSDESKISFGRWLRDNTLPYLDFNNRKKNGTISRLLKTLWFEVYPPDGATVHRKKRETTPNGVFIGTINGVSDPKNLITIDTEFFVNWHNLFLSFFGIPNRFENEITPKQIGKNFIGSVNDDAPTYLKIFNGLSWPFRLILNIVSIPIKTAWNILILFTEFLPLAIERFSEIGITKLFDYYKEENTGRLGKAFALLGIGILATINLPARIWHIIGRCITSPLESMKKAWEVGNQLGGWKGKVAGGFLVMASALITAAPYAVLCVFAAPALPVIFHGLVPSAVITPIANLPFYITALIGAATPILWSGFLLAKEKLGDWWFTKKEEPWQGDCVVRQEKVKEEVVDALPDHEHRNIVDELSKNLEKVKRAEQITTSSNPRNIEHNVISSKLTDSYAVNDRLAMTGKF